MSNSIKLKLLIIVVQFFLLNEYASAQLKRVYYVGFEHPRYSTEKYTSRESAIAELKLKTSGKNFYLASYFYDDINENHYMTFGLRHMNANKSHFTKRGEDPEAQIKKIYESGRAVVSCSETPIRGAINIVSRHIHNGRKYAYEVIGNYKNWIQWKSEYNAKEDNGLPYLLCEIDGSYYAFKFFNDLNIKTAMVWADNEKEYLKLSKRLHNEDYHGYQMEGSGGWSGTFLRKKSGALIDPVVTKRFESIDAVESFIDTAYKKGWHPRFITQGYEEYLNFSGINFPAKVIKFE